LEEVVPRQRYYRNSSNYRKKKKNVSNGNTLIDKILKQTFFSICIFIIIITIKNIDTSVTNFMSDKVKTALFQNIELKSVYANIDEFFSNLLKNKAENKNVPPEKDNSAKSSDTPATEKANAKIGDIKIDTNSEVNNIEIVKAINLKYKFVMPVDGATSSPFGDRMHPLLNKVVFHSGVDIEADKGVEIKSALSGKISETGNNPTYGNYIIIASGDNIETIYAHCSKILVKKDDRIKQSQAIGYIGDTGLTVGAHLHFEVRINKIVYDPMNFIKV
jgi:murein DD-endopeptidase MepM/ murein hydrolase activator NlpD